MGNMEPHRGNRRERRRLQKEQQEGGQQPPAVGQRMSTPRLRFMRQEQGGQISHLTAPQ